MLPSLFRLCFWSPPLTFLTCTAVNPPKSPLPPLPSPPEGPRRRLSGLALLLQNRRGGRLILSHSFSSPSLSLSSPPQAQPPQAIPRADLTSNLRQDPLFSCLPALPLLLALLACFMTVIGSVSYKENHHVRNLYRLFRRPRRKRWPTNHQFA